ncbi:LysR family transcriptional regulator [Variovorax boronicumulans]|uniref:LysR family transcriptional regulator n=1 Tax=Variovorax boronicumulans TaxID=436515 RepID=UPI0012E42B91|nr:LysR family transcriptional regulator [Variovorax boronicumulans]GER16981.1 LysR family transcriptional regulator [Variovorax boronicumulans]
MRVDITLQQLEAFVEVAKTTNFRAAAQALHVSQPALSRTVRIVEDLVGARLFDRDTRHVELTPAGRELLPIALRILENFNSSFSELSQFLEGRSGHLTIAALPSTGVALLPGAIAEFRQQHPQVQFSLIEGPAEAVRAAVDEGRADFGLSVRPGTHEPLLYRHLRDDPFVLLCRRDDPLAARGSVSWSVFATRPFIASSFQSSIRPITDAAFLQRGLQVQPALEYPSVAVAGALVAAGLGLTALPRLALQLSQNDELATVPLQRPLMSRPIGLVTRAGRSPSPVGRAFMDLLHRRESSRR